MTKAESPGRAAAVGEEPATIADSFVALVDDLRKTIDQQRANREPTEKAAGTASCDAFHCRWASPRTFVLSACRIPGPF